MALVSFIPCADSCVPQGLKPTAKTSYDEVVDKESPRPGGQTFEKMSAGLYLSEIFRQVLVDIRSRGFIFNGKAKEGEKA